MGELMITRRGGCMLDLDVRIGTSTPNFPRENTIWINTEKSSPYWKIGNANPYVHTQDIDIPVETIIDGYYSTSGVLTAQNATNKEMSWEGNTRIVQNSNGAYTEVKNLDNDVEYGKKYRYTYTLPESKSMWLAICEYKEDGSFVKRTVLVNSVTGTEKVGYYTPSDSSVVKIALSWRTFGLEYDIGFSEINVEKIDDEIPNNVIWIKDDRYGTVDVDTFIGSDRHRNSSYLRISGAEILDGGVWTSVPVYVYQNDEWREAKLSLPLLSAPSQHENITGGWTSSSGTMTLYRDSIHIKGSTGRLSTAWAINTTGFKFAEFDVMCESESAATVVGIGTNQSSRVAFETLPLSMTDYQTIRVNISDYQGMYYVNMQTAATSVGCYVKAVRLVGQ